MTAVSAQLDLLASGDPDLDPHRVPARRGMTLGSDAARSRRTRKTIAERRSRTIPIATGVVQGTAGRGRREGCIDWPVTSGGRRVRHSVSRNARLRAEIVAAEWQRRTSRAYRKGFVCGLIELGANREPVEYPVGVRDVSIPQIPRRSAKGKPSK